MFLADPVSVSIIFPRKVSSSQYNGGNKNKPLKGLANKTSFSTRLIKFLIKVTSVA